MSEINEEPPEPAEFDFQYEILPEDITVFDLSFKLIVIGDSGVGKTCLTNRAVKNIYKDYYSPTVGFDFFEFNVKINDKIIKLQIWDTCGQEIYRSLITNYYRNSSLAIMVYAIDSIESFQNIETWLRELRIHSNPDAKVFLIGNKLDLENMRQVSKILAERYSKDNKIDFFLEASAKDGLNTQKIFIKAAKLLLDDYIKYGKNGKNNEKKVVYDSQNNLQQKYKIVNRHPTEDSEICC